MEKNKNIINLTELSVQPQVHSLDRKIGVINKKVVLVGVLIVVVGIISGNQLANMTSGQIQPELASDKNDGSTTKITVGSPDSKTFKDSTEGTLEIGGINGEGTHKLIRPGGESQTVYLTSSVLDLSQFEGKKVRVLGETFAAKKAGWLMDVGKIEEL